MPDPRTLRWCFYALLIGLAGSSYWWIPKIGSGSELARAGTQAPPIRTFANAFLAAANLAFLAAMYFQFQQNLHAFLLITAVNAAVLWAVAFARDVWELRSYTATLAIGVALLACSLLLKEYGSFLQHWDHWSRLSFVMTGVVLVGGGLAYWLGRERIPGEIELFVHGPLTIVGHLVLLAVLTAEIVVFFGTYESWSTGQMATFSVAWGVYASLLVGSGFLLRYPLARYLGIALFGLVLLKVFLVDLSQVELIIRVIALLILGLLLLGVSLLYQKFKSRIGLEV